MNHDTGVFIVLGILSRHVPVLLSAENQLLDLMEENQIVRRMFSDGSVCKNSNPGRTVCVEVCMCVRMHVCIQRLSSSDYSYNVYFYVKLLLQHYLH